MNRPIVRTYVFVLALLALLVYFTSKWAVLDASELDGEPGNRRALIETAQIRRGTITTSDGQVIAESKADGRGENAVYERNYPQGSLYAHPVGTSFIETGNTGIEQSENDLLIGEDNEFQSLIDQVQDRGQEGADLTLTLDSKIQQVATTALQSSLDSTAGTNGAGSVVALDPSTGAVKAMVSLPTYDPNQYENDAEQVNSAEGSPIVNRPVFGQYPPGSTFKVVSAATALDSGEFTPDTSLNADSGIDIGGVPLANDLDENFGTITMREALTFSVNTYWGQVGEQLGSDTMFDYMRRFGFEEDPELDYPPEQMQPSGVFNENGSGELLGPNSGVDIGRVAIGQSSLLATPLQMAEVAATIANQGELMEPTLLQEAKDPDGRTIAELDPNVQDRAISSDAAGEVAELMTSVAEEGTASGLSVPGSTFAGKTGTAEINVADGTNRPWFIAFAPVDDPKIAVAVNLEQCTGCFGGEAAGPVATQVMEAALNAAG